jgi:outer membrane protein TolC
MCEQVKRVASAGVMCLALLALAVSVSGQDLSAGGTGGQASAGPVVKRLSVNDAVQLALEQNLDLQVQRVNPQVQDLNFASLRTFYTPNLTSSFSSGGTDSPAGNIFSGTGSTQTNTSLNWSVGASQQLPWGGNYSASWTGSRAKSNSLFDNINPRLNSGLNLSFTQPLMRNFGIDSTRQQLIVNRKNREISDVQLRQMVLTTVRNVKSAYWDLSYYTSLLAVQRQSLDLARESLRNNESRVRIGTMAPIDIIQAQAEVASREEAVISAEAALARAEDTFRTLIMDPQATPDFWKITFELSESPNFEARDVDADAAVQAALAKRTDLINQRKSLEINDVTLRYMRNQILPDVNVNARYGLSAQGGSLLGYDYSNVLNPVYLGVTDQVGFGSIMKSLVKNDFPAWSFAVSIAYPIGKSTAEASLARARLQYGQAQTQLRTAELTVATQVRDAARQVNANAKRVGSTRASRELQEKKLEAEQKKFAAGLQTTFFVLQAQRDLAQARNAELQAILDYTRSLVNFETVQEAPVGGSSGGGIIIQ